MPFRVRCQANVRSWLAPEATCLVVYCCGARRRNTVEESYEYFASEVAVRAANAAVQAQGGYGYVDEYPVGKYLRHARVSAFL